VNAIPDCPPFYGGLPDRNGDYGLYGLNNQTSTHLEKAGPFARPAKPPLHYRPPAGQWSPQTGMGTPEMRFVTRTYRKGEETRPPTFRVKGSSPLRRGTSYVRSSGLSNPVEASRSSACCYPRAQPPDADANTYFRSSRALACGSLVPMTARNFPSTKTIPGTTRLRRRAQKRQHRAR
jgi:hypothetical protein